MLDFKATYDRCSGQTIDLGAFCAGTPQAFYLHEYKMLCLPTSKGGHFTTGYTLKSYKNFTTKIPDKLDTSSPNTYVFGFKVQAKFQYFCPNLSIPYLHAFLAVFVFIFKLLAISS